MKSKICHLRSSDLEKTFRAKLSPKVRKKIKSYKFKYRKYFPEERDQLIVQIIQALLSDLPKSGKERLSTWEKGWGENFDLLQKEEDLHSITPRYFGKYPVLRWREEFIKPLSPDFEKNSLSAITDWLFDEYLSTPKTVYEFGCGAGYHLLNLRKYNHSANLVGLDWAQSSQKIIRHLARMTNDQKLSGRRFNFFNPDPKLNLAKDSGVYTIAALEQTGKDFGKFIDFLLKNKPKIVVHIEPIAELLDQNKLLDFLSIEYFKKRNYLSGFLGYLRKLEKAKKIKIIKAQRTYIGSLFIEGYSVVVWFPIRE